MSITSINRETDLDEMIEEVKRRKEAGMPSLGKASMVDYELCKSRDEAQRRARPHLFFDSQKHVRSFFGNGGAREYCFPTTLLAKFFAEGIQACDSIR